MKKNNTIHNGCFGVGTEYVVMDIDEMVFLPFGFVLSINRFIIDKNMYYSHV